MELGAEKRIRIRKRPRDAQGFWWQVIHGFLRLFAIAAVFTLAWYITRLDVFTIRDIRVSGGETISHDEVRSLVESQLIGAYFLIIPKRFTYMYPHDRAVTAVLGNDRVKDVTMERKGRTTLSVAITEFVPYALWCPEEGSGAACFFIDESGYAFTQAPQLSGNTLVRYVLEGVADVTRGETLGIPDIGALTAFMERGERELGFRFNNIFFRKDGDIELRMAGGARVIVSSTRDLTRSFQDLLSVLASDEFKHLEPDNFNYIDLRFGNKVFVNEEIEASASTTPALPE